MNYDLKKLIATMWQYRDARNFGKTGLLSNYRGLNVKGSIGLGNIAAIPWVSYCAKGQSTNNGIYPVILFYGTPEFQEKLTNNNKVKKIVLAFGISSENKPKLDWGDVVNDQKTIGDYFNIWQYVTKSAVIKKYNSSYVYKSYDWTDDVDYDLIQRDLDELITVYLEIMKNHDNYNSIVKDENTVSEGNNKEDKHASLLMKTIIEQINKTGLIFDSNFIKRYVSSLITKPFVILSGLTGSGKTQLAIVFAKLICKDNSQYEIIPVGADWSNRDPLLGYPNALQEGKYKETRVLQLIQRASNDKNRDKPYFLILDEMNMSYVERYFADFLSAMESREKIPLWEEGNNKVPSSIELPNNLFIVGTINVDETTYMFSPKVLDRANVLEFRIQSQQMKQYLNSTHTLTADVNISDMAKVFVKIAKQDINKELSKDTKDTLMEMFNSLAKIQKEFGYRTAHEMSRFINIAEEFAGMKENDAIDAAIVQKLLPKIHGSRKKVTPVLKALWRICYIKEATEIDTLVEMPELSVFKYQLTADKIWRMFIIAQDNGFTSFAEA